MADTFVPPDISSDVAELQREAIGLARKLEFQLGGALCHLRLKAVSSVAEAESVRLNRWLARLIAPANEYWVAMSDVGRLAVVTSLLGDVALDELPRELLPAVLEVAFADGFAQLAAGGLGQWEISEVVSYDSLPASLEMIDAAVTIGAESYDLQIIGRHEAIRRLLELSRSAPLAELPVPHDLSVRARVELGTTWLTEDELRSLRLHDVIVLDNARESPTQHATLRVSPNVAWRIAMEGTEIRLQGVEPKSSDDHVGSDRNSFPVCFSQGTIDISVSSLPALAADATLPWHSDGKVDILAGEVSLGRGELVGIAGRWGVRLVEIAASKPA